MSDDVFARAEAFIWSNARLLDRHLFAFHFRGGPREAVLHTLRAYQNPDGGFGNALEPDIRCPESQPVPVQHALEVLDAVGPEPALIARLCDFLQGITTEEGGVPWLLPSALGYPRAPWWQTEAGLPASLNPTGGIVALLLKHHVRHPWVERAAAYCWARLEAGLPTEMHEVGTALEFLYHASERERAEAMLARLVARMQEQGLIAPAGAAGYVRKALDWSPTPDHPLRPFIPAAAVQAHLDELVAAQLDDGGWPLTFPATSPAVEQEWRGHVALRTLLTLRANGRLPGR